MNKLTKLLNQIYQELDLINKNQIKEVGNKINNTHKVMLKYGPFINCTFESNVRDYFEKKKSHSYVTNDFEWAETVLLYAPSSRELSAKQAAAISSAVTDIVACISTPHGDKDNKKDKFTALWSEFNARDYIALFSGFESMLKEPKEQGSIKPYHHLPWIDPRENEATSMNQKYFNQVLEIIYDEVNQSYWKVENIVAEYISSNKHLKRDKIVDRLIQKRREDLGIYVKKSKISSFIK